MRAAIISMLIAGSLFATSLDRRVELLEMAVVKLINQNHNLKTNLDLLKTKIDMQNRQITLLNERVNKLSNLKVKHFAIVKASLLNIRALPNTKSKIVGKYRQFDLVRILEFVRNKKNELWCKTPKGYISSYYLDIFERIRK